MAKKRAKRVPHFASKSDEAHTTEFFQFLKGMAYHGAAIKDALHRDNCTEALDKFGWMSVSRGAARVSIDSFSYDHPKGYVREKLAEAEEKAATIQRALVKKCLR